MKTKIITKEIFVGAIILIIGILFFIFSNYINNDNLKGDITAIKEETPDLPPQVDVINPSTNSAPTPAF